MNTRNGTRKNGGNGVDSQVRNLRIELSRFQLRLVAAALLVLCALALVGWRLYALQVLRHDALTERADTNRTAVTPIVPERGEIYDRNGVLLASNYKAYTLEITPAQVQRPLDEVIDAIANIVPVTRLDRRRFARLRANSRSFESLPLLTRLSDADVARLASQIYHFKGIEIRARWFRSYPQGRTAAHVIGHIGRINAQEKDAIEASDEVANYRGTQYIGKLGVEKSYETLLHGTTGVDHTEISASGRAVRPLVTRPAVPGESIRLSLDIGLQRLAEELFGDHRGALVAIDPSTGEVLAMVSQPSYDPNLFVEGIDQPTWDALNNSLDYPLLNRALRSAYPPGSTYKPFMALAALETGVRQADTAIMDGGSWTYKGHTFRALHALGRVDLYKSIVKSSNVYYYQLAADLGVDRIHDFMAPLRLGQITGIDIPGEKPGVLPSKAWKAQTYKTREQQTWYPGETISLGIGQGYNNFTMLQLASATATLAAGGMHRPPHLIQARSDPQTGKLVPVPPPDADDLGYAPEHVAAVLQGMVGVTQEGTSRFVFAGAPYISGGKTGTAQAISIGKDSRYNAAELAERQRDHSVYIGFAPAEAPRIAVAALVENAGFGAAYAAPVVRRVMDYWLAGLVPTDEDITKVVAGKGGAPVDSYPGSFMTTRQRKLAEVAQLSAAH
ncbi:MAG: penicillin-binding protein 2 [Ottowia sp.]|nr:penicillin-binding protein 2 [Ottowia sp.]